MLTLLADIVVRRGWWEGDVSTWGFAELCAAIVIIAGLVAIVLIVLRKFGLVIPDWLWQIGVVVIVCLVALFAIRMISRM